MFDLENIKTLPYFLCIWAKLEVGSKMGYLLISGREVYQQTEVSAGYGGGGVRAKCTSPNFVLHCVIEARNDRRMWKSEAPLTIESSPGPYGSGG